MLYLLAIVLPPIAVLVAGKPFQALINFLLLFLLWIPAVIHAVFVVHNYYADQRTDRLVRAMATGPAGASASAPIVTDFAAAPVGLTLRRTAGFGSVPIFPKPDLGVNAMAQIASGTQVAVHETRGVFTRVSVSSGSAGWMRSSDLGV